MQVFPHHFISSLAVYMHTTGGMRSGNPDAAMSNPKHTFAPFEGTFYPKVGTIEYIKVQHRPFQCLLSVCVEEVKPGDEKTREMKKHQRLSWRNQTQRTRA